MADQSVTEKDVVSTTANGNTSVSSDTERLSEAVDRTPNVEENHEEPDVVDWDGPDDPENPMNWPESRKWVNLALMSILTIISPLGSSMFAPGVAKILVEFNTNSPMVATFVVSIYFLGFAFGPLVVAPLSEIYGRVYVYHVGNFAFTIFSIGAALSVDMEMLMAFRFIMGVVGSVPTTIGVGSIVDVMALEKRGRAISLWALGPLLGPCIGPVAGGYLIERVGWRWVYWLLAIMGGVFSVLALLIMRETYAPVLLERKTRRLRKSTGNQALRSKLETHGSNKIRMAIIRPLKFLLATPLVTIIAVYVGVLYGILYLLITTFSFVYADQYNFGEGTTGLSFLPAGLGMVIGVTSFGHLQDYLVHRANKNMQPGEKYKPEVKLTPWVTIPTGFTLPIGLFIYGWTTHYKVHWIVPMIGVVILSAGLTGVTMCVQNYQMDSYPRYAASGSAAVMLLRSLIGALLPLGGLKMYDALGLGWGNSLLAFMCLTLVPVPVLLYLYGQRLRQKFDPVL
ncbi:polyamine transporter 3 [Colletotrichum karsti]|uniref:Polyamine transporter 3 n=1 Tax=Colletotrichum karsti TaxID=1095194 RepID=A0A9P6HWZ9_9PEZI|nr:polyamine transporter 3 [Colletotrichum karsti]KAF9872388.1 polyamine transporter 3 [Colletotrichum karsti]